MIDSHCHLADDAFVKDAAEVISRARSAGVTQALCILAAENDAEHLRATDLSRSWPTLRFGTGIHPHQAGAYQGRASDVTELVETAIARNSHIRAVGEIGLDYHYDFAPKDVQHDVFRAQIRLARKLDLPIVIHTREAEDDTINILREETGGAVRGVLHCFTGTPKLAEAGLALGLHISFSGIITFPKAAELREVAATVPMDRLLSETDSPYLAPTPHRGKRNEPAWVVRVAEQLAELRGMRPEDLTGEIDANFARVFRP